MKIGLVGYQGSGKSTLFEWLTCVASDPALSHTAQSAMATIPEPRLEQLAEIYHSKKLSPAALEIVDTPGLSRTHEGNAARLAMIREAECLVLVVAAFDGSRPFGAGHPCPSDGVAADTESFHEDLMLADMEILTGRLGRIEETLKKPIARTEQEQLRHEQQILQTVLSAMESGSPMREADMTEDQLKVTRAFRLLSEKPRILVVNTADDEEDPGRYTALSTGSVPLMAIPAGLELELSKMSPEDRLEFEQEMGLQSVDRDHVIRKLLEAAGQMLFFTCNQREVRCWLLRRGGTALEAAGTVHSDMARGFIRAEVTTCADLIRLGSEREVKAQHLVRQEPKDYIVQDGDILFIRFSV
jgi:ribosome-binding ATPase YchF (GTP1/OBG family)